MLKNNLQLKSHYITLSGNMPVLLSFLFFSCCTTKSINNSSSNENKVNDIFKGEKTISYIVGDGEIYTYTSILINEYLLKIYNEKDFILLIPYKIKTKENRNYYCFDFPYGNMKWDFKNMLLRKRQIINLKAVRKNNKLLEYAQTENIKFYDSLINKNNREDTIKRQLLHFGVMLKENIKEITSSPKSIIIFEPISKL